MTYYRLTLKSSNKKTGPIPVSTTSSDTCWDGCALFEFCYAKQQPLQGRWAEVDRGEHSTDLAGFTAKIALLPDGQLWRHDQAGDLPGQGAQIDSDGVAQIAEANRGKRGFTYTHKPVIGTKYRSNAAIIAAANQAGFTVNLSGNNLPHADELAELGIGPVVSMLPADYARKSKGNRWTETLAEWRARVPQDIRTPKARSVKPCPATYLDTTCADCQLCQRQNRKVIVGFPGHGSRKAGADAVAKGV